MVHEQLRKAVRKAGKSVNATAKKAGLPTSGVARFLRGGGLQVRSAEKLAAALGFAIRLEPVANKPAA